MSSPPVRLAVVMLLWLLGTASPAHPQQAAPAAGEPLTITTESLPRWAAHFPYDFPLHAEFHGVVTRVNEKDLKAPAKSAIAEGPSTHALIDPLKLISACKYRL